MYGMIQQLNQSFNKQEKHQMHCHNLKKKPSDLSSPHYTSCCVLHILFSLQHILLCHPHYTSCCVLPTTHSAVFSPQHILLCSPHYTSCCVIPSTHPAVFSPLHTQLWRKCWGLTFRQTSFWSAPPPLVFQQTLQCHPQWRQSRPSWQSWEVFPLWRPQKQTLHLSHAVGHACIICASPHHFQKQKINKKNLKYLDLFQRHVLKFGNVP